jgi:predicted GTPase
VGISIEDESEGGITMQRVVIMGAAGRDFHNFNVVYRDDPHAEVVAFTAAQIPFIADRRYPTELAGARYTEGIPIYPEENLARLIEEKRVDAVVFAYSDVSHEYVMHRASEVLAAGADFQLLGPKATMIPTTIPVVAVCAVRTGAGKSQTTRRIAEILRDEGLRPVVVRHPMPYGDLLAERVQRFDSSEELDQTDVTIEEREEYEHHLAEGTPVVVGVDYQAILEEVESMGDVLLFDGGNNDLPFYRPTVHIVIADPLRVGHESVYHPGETNVRMADVVMINKVNVADEAEVRALEANIRSLNPGAAIVRAASVVDVDDPDAIAGRRVLVVEDGPTLTHGGMKYGAGVVAARQYGAAEIVDPRRYAEGTLAEILDRYDVGPVLPAEGYSAEQRYELQRAIDATPADLVVIATPIDLRRIVKIDKPCVRVTYRLEELPSQPSLHSIVDPAICVAKARREEG